MPHGDSTGPRAAGRMTGRGAGYCGGGNAPGYESSPGGGRRGGVSPEGVSTWPRPPQSLPGHRADRLGTRVRGPGPRSIAPPATPDSSHERDCHPASTQNERIERALGDIRQRLADLEAK
ncbi:MAG: DUF5320 family protein [Thermoleophilia bacterium]